MRIAGLLIIGLLLIVSSVRGQEYSNGVYVYATDWTLDGNIVAVALYDQVQIYSMQRLDVPPLIYPVDRPLALAFSHTEAVTDENNVIYEVLRLAIGTEDNIQIIHPLSLDLQHTIDQPASQLLWTESDYTLIAGWEDTITFFDASWVSVVYENDPYEVTRQYTIPLPENADEGGRWQIGSFYMWRNELLISWDYTVDYGNHGAMWDGVLYWEFEPEQPPIEAPAYLVPVVYAAARERTNEDRTRMLIGTRWVDFNTGVAVTLPLP